MAKSAKTFNWTLDPEGRRKMRQARYDAFYAIQAQYPGTEAWVTDVCVPLSRLAECIVKTEEDFAPSYLPALILGHVGDGNFHVGIPLHPADLREVAEAERLNERLAVVPWRSRGPARASMESAMAKWISWSPSMARR
jgi:D-lactate dehydrogenase (cytochrome)